MILKASSKNEQDCVSADCFLTSNEIYSLGTVWFSKELLAKGVSWKCFQNTELFLPSPAKIVALPKLTGGFYCVTIATQLID